MLWKGERESDNVVDARGIGGKTMGAGGLIIGAIVYYLMGGNPLVYLAQNVGSVQQSTPVSEGRDTEKKSFVSVVLADTEDTWTQIFSQGSTSYVAPKLVLFRNSVDSACGTASSAAGPFYCPGDRRVYLDLSFLDELSSKLGAQGEFAAAYVIAHEVGHHVQNLLGLQGMASHQQGALGSGEGNRSSVQIELQADCLAGVWAKQTEQSKAVIQAGDIEQALVAAAAVGDDRLQKQSQGYVVPDSFTHGSSAQRVSAFKQGYSGGDLQSCTRSLAQLAPSDSE